MSTIQFYQKHKPRNYTVFNNSQEDLARYRRTSTSLPEENIEDVYEMVLENRHASVRVIIGKLNIFFLNFLEKKCLWTLS